MVKNTLICILKNSISIFGVQFQYLNIIFDYLNLTQTIMGEAFFLHGISVYFKIA
jgi:hypothetical protein